MSIIAYDKRLAEADQKIHAYEVDEHAAHEQRRLSRGRAWLLLLMISLGIWGVVGVVVYRAVM